MTIRDATNPPYNDPDLDQKFSQLTARLPGRTYEGKPSITNISVVGAAFDKHRRLLNDDAYTIQKTMTALRAADIHVAENMRFYFYNLLPPISSDFMKATLVDMVAPQSDVAILCGICNIKDRDAVLSNMPEEQNTAYEDFRQMYRDWIQFDINREMGSSVLQLEDGTWPLAADTAGNKIVVTRGWTIKEINSDDFLQGDLYAPAIHTDEGFEYMSNTPSENAIAIPGSLGIVINKKAITELQSQANPDHLLGQRILSL